MQAVKHNPWTIKVHAKAKNFHLEIRGSRVLSNWRFSILLKLRKLILKIESRVGPESRSRQRRYLIKSKFLCFLDKISSACGVKKLAFLKKRSNFWHLKIDFPGRRQGRFVSQVVPSRLSQYMVWNKLIGLLLLLLPFFLYMVRSSDLMINFLILLTEALGTSAEHS
ncbi:uncharacterized protein LOC122082585 [Macadamia integrifolia]|uniref:uncharacterized protein LOC122082585 n=1 Tax=Macadamia integrifolia TaxID=60698 RepID=UPI001C4FFBE0|nr:uncharacterized protein LOC122082585 [Macadamia integrifolia]